MHSISPSTLQDPSPLLLVLCSVFVLAACSRSYTTPMEANTGSERDAEGEERAQTLVDFAQCGPNAAWSLDNEMMPSYSVPMAFAFAPHGGSLLAPVGDWGESRMLRAASGEVAFGLEGSIPYGSFSNDWALRTVAVDGGVSLVAMTTGSPLWDVVVEPGLSFLGAQVSQGGSRVVIGQCTDRSVRFTAWSTLGVEDPIEVEFEASCRDFQPFGHDMFHVSPDGSTVLVGLGADQEFSIAVLDMDRGVTTMRVPEDFNEERVGDIWMAHGTLGAAFHPDSSQVAVVHADGRLRFWSLPGVEPVHTSLEVGVLTLNLMSFVPSATSPVAWSPDGSTIALTLQDGSIAVRSLATGQEHLQIPHPDANFERLTSNVPARLAFSPDGSALGVLYERGATLWSCPDVSAPEPRTDIRVRLDGPARLSRGEEGVWTATHLDDLSIHSHAFFINDEPISEPSTERGLSWVASEAGVYTLRVVVDDGFHRGSSEMTVTVE